LFERKNGTPEICLSMWGKPAAGEEGSSVGIAGETRNGLPRKDSRGLLSGDRVLESSPRRGYKYRRSKRPKGGGEGKKRSFSEGSLGCSPFDELATVGKSLFESCGRGRLGGKREKIKKNKKPGGETGCNQGKETTRHLLSITTTPGMKGSHGRGRE